MKILIFLRHGKSSWKQEDIDDSLRQLKSSGIEEIQEVSAFFAQKKINIDRVLSSPAIRAYNTSLIFMHALNIPVSSLVLDERIYESTAALIIKSIQRTPDSVNTLLVVGHNPSLSSTIEHLSSEAYTELPTGALVTLQAPITSWKEIKKLSAKKLFQIIPSRHTKKDEHTQDN